MSKPIPPIPPNAKKFFTVVDASTVYYINWFWPKNDPDSELAMWDLGLAHLWTENQRAVIAALAIRFWQKEQERGSNLGHKLDCEVAMDQWKAWEQSK